jgi:hypothetical protein
MYKGRCSLLAIALAGAGTVAAVPVANADRLPAPRQVVVRLTKSGAHAPDSLHAGRYRMEVRAPREGAGLLILVKPDRGYTRADLRADARAARRAGDAANRRIRQSIRFFGGAEVRPGGTGALWETLYAGRYWLVGLTDSARVSFQTVHVHGTPTPSRFPRVTASASTTDSALHVTRSVPQSGRMLIRNTGHGIDDLWLFPLVRGATYDDFVRWVHHPRPPEPFGLRGIRTTAQLSPDAGYVLRYRLRPGRYVVMDSHTLNRVFLDRPVENLRRLTRPMTVRHTAVEVSPRSRAEGFRAGDSGVHGTDGWLTPRARTLLEKSGLVAAVPGLAR